MLLSTRDWRGRRVHSPCYEFRDPEEQPTPGNGKLAVGLPVLLLHTSAEGGVGGDAAVDVM